MDWYWLYVFGFKHYYLVWVFLSAQGAVMLMIARFANFFLLISVVINYILLHASRALIISTFQHRMLELYAKFVLEKSMEGEGYDFIEAPHFDTEFYKQVRN